MTKNDDGTRSKETFDLKTQRWRPAEEIALSETSQGFETLMFDDSPEGRLAWSLMGGTLCYAADLIPEIADDIVNVDNAMKWGFGWRQGPFEMLDTLGPHRVIARLKLEERPIPVMLQSLERADVDRFYRQGGQEALSLSGKYRPIR